MQGYINNSDFNISDIQLLFKLRTRMMNVKANFRNQYNNDDIICKFCDEGVEESQYHQLECQTIINNCPELFNDISVEYEDIFKGPEKQLKIVKLFHAIVNTRDKLISENENDRQTI